MNELSTTPPPVADLPRAKLQTFDHRGVRLLPGRLLAQTRKTAEVYGTYSNDSILKGFRRKAGQPAPGEDMRGWCSTSSAVIFGQLLSGLARLGRATDDEALLDKARALYEGWKATLPADGNAGMRPYDWEKLVCGLVDLDRYVGVPDALETLARITDWAAATFDRARRPADGHDFWGAGPGNTSEWYTLPENLYRAWLATGDRRFRDFAQVWLYEDYWRPFATSAMPAEVLPVHAYSHVNSFSSAAMAYAVTGDERYLRICINAYDFLLKTQCYATGGYGPDERLMPPDGSLGRSLEVLNWHAEIPCGSWAAIKLSRYLIRFTGEARFGDWMETVLLNGIGAALPTEPDGHTYYYGNYSLSGGVKQFYWHEWPCCAGTYLQSVADYGDMIYLHGPGALYVNLFVPSELTWEHAGRTVRLRQETAWPESETTCFHIDLEEPARFALNLRVPGWATSASASLNGEPLPVEAVPGSWAVVEREWRPGDQLAFTLPMRLRTLPVDPQHPKIAAILFGPTVLAQDEACCRRPFALSATADLERYLVREEGPLRFRLINTLPERHTRYLQPLYTFPAYWPYWVYFDLAAPPLY